MAHVLLVVSRRFNGHELWVSLGTLQRRGHTFEVVSTSRVLHDEVTGKGIHVKRLQEEVPNLEGVDGLMYVSGNMDDTEANWYNSKTEEMTKEAMIRDIPIAAICCSVPATRWAVKGKKVSCFPLLREKALLNKFGAVIQDVAATVDGKLVTAEHQMATQIWVEAFCDVIETGKSDLHLASSGMDRVGLRERKPIPEVENLKEIMKRTGKKSFKE